MNTICIKVLCTEQNKNKKARVLTFRFGYFCFGQFSPLLFKTHFLPFNALSSKGEAMGTAAPLIITVYPRNDGVLSRRLVVAIRVPSTYQQSPPNPTDSAVKIEERPGMTVYALYVFLNIQVGKESIVPSFYLFIYSFKFTGSLEASRVRPSTERRPCV